MSEILLRRIQERLETLGLSPRAVSLTVSGNPDTVRNILRGKSASPRVDTLEKLALVLKTTPQWLTGVDASSDAPAGAMAAGLSGKIANMPAGAFANDVPVMGTAAGSLAQGAFQFEGGVIDYVRRPPALVGSRDIYAIYVEGDSMFPEHRAGDLRFVHPHRPARIGDSVVVQTRKHESAPIEATIGHLKKVTHDRVILGKINPPASVDLIRGTVVAIHRVMTMNDLFGA